MRHILNIIQHIVFRASAAKIIPLMVIHDKKSTTFETIIQDKNRNIPFNFTFTNKIN